MATKVWKGFLTFGLLSIPVYLNTAARHNRIELNTFHKACDSRVRMPKWCPKCEVQLQPTEIYKGYSQSETKIVPLTEKELDELEPETLHTMEISECVLWKDVDPVYLAETYYLLPDTAGAKAYSLLVQTLRDTGRCAVAQLTKSGREHVVILRPKDKGLMLHFLWYEDEVNRVPEFEALQTVSVTAGEIKLAKSLAESLSGDFEPSKFEDTYRQRLNTLIASKLDSTVEAPAPVKASAKREAVDIMAALEASLIDRPKRKITPQPSAKGKKGKAA